MEYVVLVKIDFDVDIDMVNRDELLKLLKYIQQVLLKMVSLQNTIQASLYKIFHLIH